MVGDIKEVEFVLENCEVITIPGKYIGELDINNIRTTFGRIACNAFSKRTCSDSIYIEIHKDANVDYLPFGVENLKTKIFDRLAGGNDITHIKYSLINDDGEILAQEDITPTWTGESDYENEAQKSYVSKLGHLYIVIDKDNDVDSIFGDDINDEDYMDFHFDMCDIGDKYSDVSRYSANETEVSKES